MRQAEKWRVQVIREVSKKVSQIQNREYMCVYMQLIESSVTCIIMSLAQTEVLCKCSEPVYFAYFSTCIYMRISKNHNSLGCEQPLCEDALIFS